MPKQINFINYIGNYLIFIRYKKKTKVIFKLILLNDIKNFLFYITFLTRLT